MSKRRGNSRQELPSEVVSLAAGYSNLENTVDSVWSER